MSTIELKEKLIDQLNKIEETALLEHIMGILKFELSEKTVKIPDFYEKRLDKSIEEKSKGQVKSNKEVEKGIEKWLYK